MPSIILATLNARYAHSSLGLRYLYANLNDGLRAQAVIREFIITSRPSDIAEQLLRENPRIIGLGVYIWNVAQTTQLVALLKRIAPEVVIVLGGPEVSHEIEEQPIAQLADFVLPGQADLSFNQLCERITRHDPPRDKILASPPPRLADLRLPYRYYSDQDIAHRVLYVEASRGCPFKCEFCLSALDKTAVPFDLEAFLAEMDALYRRGARQFKFVDRTFNLKIEASVRIMEFFLARLDETLFLHFEVIPDHLPERLKEVIKRFPEGSLQFEIGVQSFTPEVQALISRKQDNAKTEANLRWLRQESHAHLHTDLILGLPGESLEQIAAGFDRLVALDPHEIQVGILKRLRGAPIARHTQAFGIRYNPHPPYDILCSDLLDFPTLQRLNRFARYWDMIGNSGRFRAALPLILGTRPFANFLRLSDRLHEACGQTHKIALDRLFQMLHAALPPLFDIDPAQVEAALLEDHGRSGLKGPPGFFRAGPEASPAPPAKTRTPARQARHRA
ncbi:MAG: DUF4080 domain-containing protein [Pseudomonadota bacterium]